jgi:hypothetical protein
LVDLHACSLGAEGAAELAPVIANVTELELRSNGLGPGGAHALVLALESRRQPLRLGLGSNWLEAKDADEFAPAVERGKLAALHLDGNPLGEGGSVNLAERLWRAKILEVLGLEDCGLGENDAESIALALAVNESLQHLCLSGNMIGERGIDYLAESLPENRTLKSLVLSGTGATSHAAEKLKSGIEHNTALTQCVLGHNPGVSRESLEGIDAALRLNRAVDKVTAMQNSSAPDPRSAASRRDPDALHRKPATLAEVVREAVGRGVDHGPVYWRTVSWTSLQSGKGLDHVEHSLHAERKPMKELFRSNVEHVMTSLHEARLASHIKDLESRVRLNDGSGKKNEDD